MDSRLSVVLASLLDGRLESLTYSLGFLSAPPGRVARAARMSRAHIDLH